ncbi:MAG: O-antigen ligase family protein [Candidatus Levybacteria bacterium]|nr:O-antigen ligase family protein [Candidatus Levybacteria bacterium]
MFFSSKKSNIKNQKSKISQKLKTFRFSLGFVPPQRDPAVAVTLCALLFALLLVGVFLSKSPAAGLYGFLKLLEFTFFGVFTAWFLTKNSKAYSTVLLLFAVGIIGESFLAIVQFLNQGSIGGIFYWFGERSFTSQTPGIANAAVSGKLVLRPYATFPHPNVLAGYLVIGMTLISLKCKAQSAKLEKALYSIALMLGTIALLLTMSRVSIVVFLVCVIVVLYKKLPKKHRAFGIISCLVAITIIFLLLPHRSFSLSLNDESISIRRDLLVASFTMFWEHPIFGVGLNNFLLSLPSYLSNKHSVFFLQPVHNIFFLWFCQTGLAGATLAILFFFSLYKQLRRHYIWGKWLLVFSLIAFGSVDHYLLTLQQGKLLLAFVLGLMWTGKKLSAQV